MGDFVVAGAMLKCDKGLGPGTSTLIVLPTGMVDAGGKPVATIMDSMFIKNIPPFGMCTSDVNPTVIAATAAAQGVKTPGACLPAVISPWSPGSAKTTVGGLKALTKDSKCNCGYGGSISVSNEGQVKASVG